MTLTGRMYIAGTLTMFMFFLTLGQEFSPLKTMAFGISAIGYACLFPTRKERAEKQKAGFPRP